MQETAEQYRARMFNFAGNVDALKLQAAAPKKLERLLKGLTTARARKRPTPDKWSISEIVCHLSDAELVVGFRIRAILGWPGGPVQGFDQDAWVKALHYERRDLRKAFEQYRALREVNLALLKLLKSAEFKTIGMHSERGPESVETIVRMTAGHDVNHINQIEAILAGKR